jgi:membrane-bound serine protease (ClpP class)
MHAGIAQGSTVPLGRRASRTVATACLALGVLAAWWPGSASAAAQQQPVVNVVEASGLLDPVVVDFLVASIRDSEASGAEALVIQLDSEGSVVSDEELDVLLTRVHTAEVPVAVWVGPSGARATGGAALLVARAHLSGMAPRSRVGDAPDHDLYPAPPALRRGTLDPDEALEAGVVAMNEEEAAVLGTFIAALDGKEAAGRVLETADFEQADDGPPQASLTVQTRLAKLDLPAQLMHTVASPAVAYLLLAAALGLLLFELFTAGVGIAGVVGAVCGVLAAYGLAVLPISWLGLGLVLVGMFGFAVDLQTGVPRVWTAIGTVAFATGSVLLFDGVPRPWLALVVGVVGMVVAMLAGMPAMIRTRFSTPTIGRESMIGEAGAAVAAVSPDGVVGMVVAMLAGMPAMIRTRFSTPTIGRESMIGEAGAAVAAVSPDGVVRVRDALWRARTNRATPIDAGAAVRVVGIDGLVLEVEPEEGGARDYRDAARRRGAKGP